MSAFKSTTYLAFVLGALLHAPYSAADEASPGSHRSAPGCAARYRVAVIGDSLVAGFGDESESEGYIGRLREQYPYLDIRAIGFPGADTKELYTLLSKAPHSRLSQRAWALLEGADMVILSIGLNDYWASFSGPESYANMRATSLLLQRTLHSRFGGTPIVIATTLPQPRNADQRKWLGYLNRLLRSNSLRGIRMRVRLEEMPRKYVSSDDTHPSADGHAWIADRFSSYFDFVVPPSYRDLPIIPDSCETEVPQTDWFQQINPDKKNDRYAERYGRALRSNANKKDDTN